MKIKTSILTIILTVALPLASAEARPLAASSKAATAHVAVPAKGQSFLKRVLYAICGKRPAAIAPKVPGLAAKPAPKKVVVSKPKSSKPKKAVATASRRKPAAKVAVRAVVKASPTKVSPAMEVEIIKVKTLTAPAPKIASPSPFAAKPVAATAHPKAPKWKPTYSKTALGCAWEKAWTDVTPQLARATSAEIERKEARVTAYSKTERRADANTMNGKTSTGIALRAATETQIGVAAGHPEDIGKYVTVTTPKGSRTYLIADTGSALVSKQADTRRVGEVIDLYAPGGEQWSSYQQVTIVALEGAAHLLLTPPSERRKFLEWNTYRRALAMALKS